MTRADHRRGRLVVFRAPITDPTQIQGRLESSTRMPYPESIASEWYGPCCRGGCSIPRHTTERPMIRKLKDGQYRLYSRKKDATTGKRRNLGTFATLEAAKRHERQVQFFKRQG